MPEPSKTLSSTKLDEIGHSDAMQDIDAFLSITLVETERSLARAEMAGTS